MALTLSEAIGVAVCNARVHDNDKRTWNVFRLKSDELETGYIVRDSQLPPSRAQRYIKIATVTRDGRSNDFIVSFPV